MNYIDELLDLFTGPLESIPALDNEPITMAEPSTEVSQGIADNDIDALVDGFDIAIAEAADEALFVAENAEEIQPRGTGPQHAKTSFRKLAEAFASCAGQQHIIIQAKPAGDEKGFFYVYDSNEAINADTEALHACRFVRERVNPRYQRLGYADIDSKRYGVRAIHVAWAQAWPDASLPAFYETNKGYHCVGSQWVTIKEHRRGLDTLADALIDGGVDKGALHGLRLAGTLDKLGKTRKEMTEDVRLSDTLVQPLGAPLDHEADKKRERAIGAEINVTAAEVAAGIAAITKNGMAFEVDLEQSTSERIMLKRLEESHCNICDREHDGADAYLVIEPGVVMGRAYCYRGKKKCIKFKRPDAVADLSKLYPGPFTGRTGITYQKPDGVAAAPPGDYIEGSPCGLGKSKAAWDEIDAATNADGGRPSVVLMSYRKTFSASQGGLHGCELYSDTTAPLPMTPGRRVACQYESLRRIQGVPDVLVIDELHGIRRQACGSFASTDCWVAFTRLVKDAGRVVVLDAYADDDDRALVSSIRGCPIEMVRNTHQPHTKKAIQAFSSYKDYQKGFDAFVAYFASQPKAWRLDNRFVVVCQWKKDVEVTASSLEAIGLRGKAYHGKTCAKTRAAEFANHHDAWKESEFIVYNSTLEAGVSIEGPEWKSAWVLMRGMGHVEAAIQGLHRFRAITSYNSYAASHNGGGDYPTTEAGLISAIKAGERFAAGDGPEEKGEALPTEKGELGAAAYVASMVRLGDDHTRSTFARMWIANQLEGNRSARFWPSRFYRMLSETGFQVTQIPAGALPAMLSVEKNDLPVELATAEVVTFTNSPEARIAEASASVWHAVLAENNGETPARNLSAAEIHSRDKVALMTEYQQDEKVITVYFVEELGKPRIITAHRNTKMLTQIGGDSHINAVDKLRQFQVYATHSKNKQLQPRITTHAEKATRALDALKALGFTGLDDLREVSRKDVEKALEDNAATLDTIYKARGRLWPEIQRPRKEAASFKAHLGALNGILEAQYAAKIVAINKRNERYCIKVIEWPDTLLSAFHPIVVDEQKNTPIARVNKLVAELSPDEEEAKYRLEIESILNELCPSLAPEAA